MSAGGGYTPSAEAAAWKADIIANGGTISDAVLQAFDEQFFIPAVANGSILTEVDRLNILITNSNEIAALTSVEGNNYFGEFINVVVFNDEGAASNGSDSYIDWKYNPAVDGVKLQQDDASIGYMVNQPPFSATVRAIGCTSNLSMRRLEVYELSGQSFVFLNCSNFTANPNDTSVGNVLLAGKRSDSANETVIINASEVTAADPSTGLPNNPTFELTSNDNGVPFPDYDTRPHKFSWQGSSSFDYTTCATLINNLETALAAL